MALMRSHNRQGAQHRDGLRIGLKVGGSVENGGLLEYFFLARMASHALSTKHLFNS